MKYVNLLILPISRSYSYYVSQIHQCPEIQTTHKSYNKNFIFCEKISVEDHKLFTHLLKVHDASWLHVAITYGYIS